MAAPGFTTTSTFEVLENSTSVGTIAATDTDLENLPTLFLDPNTQFNNDAILSGNIVILTSGTASAGSIFTTTPVTFGSNISFSTFFEFQIDNPQGEYHEPDAPGADGLVFVIQPNSNSAGSSGGGIGYEGITNSLGIEFDTYNNGSLYGDSNGNHVGVDLNGNIASVATQEVTLGVLNDTQPWYAWVDYSGSESLLEVRLSRTDTKPTDSVLSYTVDLPTIIGSNSAFVGFTSATGGSANDHKILDWTFTPEILTYSLTSAGADNALFEINPISGALSFLNSPDFEAPEDAGTNNIYDIQVQVTDGTTSVIQDITVTITQDPNEALTVNTLTDVTDGSVTDGSISFRDALAILSDGGIITFEPGLVGTIVLDPNLGELVIDKSLTINANTDGDANTRDITIDAQGNSRVLTVDNDNSELADVTIDGLVITGGSAIGGEGSEDEGGGIFSTENLTITNSDVTNNIAAFGGGIAIGGESRESTPSLVLTNVTVSGNSASGGENGGFGGGIYAGSYAGANLTLTNVTISGNSADASGGGIATDDYYGSIVTLSNVTVSGNSAGEQGGGLYHKSIYGGLVTLNNVTVSSNTAASASGLYYGGGEAGQDGILNINSSILANNVQEDLISAYGIVNASYSLLETGEIYINGTNGSNLFGVDPLLDPNGLQDNGGPTQTIALLPGSPALNTGSNPTNLTTDQRGFARSVGAGTDIGSFELNQAPSITSANAISIEENTTTVTTVTATDPENAALVYSITGSGADDALFTIDSASGALSFSAAPDFEAPGDSGSDNVYDVQVQVSDGVNAVT
jgi:hypothetical protein